jgi:hypothetical protein
MKKAGTSSGSAATGGREHFHVSDDGHFDPSSSGPDYWWEAEGDVFDQLFGKEEEVGAAGGETRTNESSSISHKSSGSGSSHEDKKRRAEEMAVIVIAESDDDENNVKVENAVDSRNVKILKTKH